MSSVRSGFQLTLGLMTVPVDLHSVVPSDKGRKLRTLCAKHKVPINQVYRCPKDGELNPETIKAHEVTKNQFNIVDQAELAKKEFQADAGMEIVAISTSDLEAHTVPGDALYYAKPHLSAVKPWEILYRLAGDSKRSLIGVTALRANSRKLFRITIFNEYLVLQELEFPEHVREAPERVKVSVEKALMDQAKKVLDAVEVDWSKYNLDDPMLKRFQALVEHGEVVNVATTEGETEQGQVIDLMDALKQSVDTAAKKRKAK